MNIDDLLAEARALWPNKMTDQEIAIALGVVYGDVCRAVRDAHEGRQIDDAELKKELGNIIFSTIRWCDDLGLNVAECLELAKAAQIAYVKKQRSVNQ